MILNYLIVPLAAVTGSDLFIRKTVLSDQFIIDEIGPASSFTTCLTMGCSIFGKCDVLSFDYDQNLCQSGSLDLDITTGSPRDVWILNGI